MTVPPLTAGRLLTAWTLDLPVVLAVVTVSVGYLLACARVRGWPVGRTANFLIAMAAVLIVKTSSLAVYEARADYRCFP